MFNDQEILEFKLLIQRITENPRRIPDQPHHREGVFLWCEDWEIIEILKYFVNGHEGYLGDPPPNRLKFNPLWSKEDIIKKAQALSQTFSTAAQIIAVLEARRENNVT